MTTFFNGLRPDNIAVGLNISYTVPVGKVSRVRATLSATNSGSVTSVADNVTEPMITSNSAIASMEMVLTEGDILSSVRTTGSGSTAAGSQTHTARVAACTVVMTVNGSNSCSVNANATANSNNANTGLGAVQNTTTGVADFGFIAEEYFG